jgi:hypothetical protein
VVEQCDQRPGHLLGAGHRERAPGDDATRCPSPAWPHGAPSSSPPRAAASAALSW